MGLILPLRPKDPGISLLLSIHHFRSSLSSRRLSSIRHLFRHGNNHLKYVLTMVVSRPTPLAIMVLDDGVREALEPIVLMHLPHGADLDPLAFMNGGLRCRHGLDQDHLLLVLDGDGRRE